MFGKIIAKSINKLGNSFVLIKGLNGVTYHCDNHKIKKGRIEDFNDGDYVLFDPLKDKHGNLIKDKKGKLSATNLRHQKSTDDISSLESDNEEISNNSKSVESFVSPAMLAMYEEFEQLIESEDYDGALRSKLICTTSPDKLPLDYMQKAIWAAQKLIGMDCNSTLSEFDKKIITTSKYLELPAIKKDSALMQEGLEECFKRCDSKDFQNLFNELGRANTNNASYLKIAIRFQTIYNKLYLPFYVLAIYKNPRKVFDKFLNFTQKNFYFDYFIAFNKIVRNTYFLGREIDLNYITKILAISLDADRFDLYKEFCSEILGEIPDYVQWVDQEEIQCEKIVEMLSPNYFFEKKVVEKYINFYMYKKLNDGKLNDRLLELLSEIAYRNSVSDLDEILSNNSYVGFNKSYKRNLLLVNFIKIVEYMKINPKAYLLACFVIRYFMDENAVLPEECSDMIRTFTGDLLKSVKTSPESLYEIYPLFKLDISGRRTIEEAFCDYLDDTCSRSVSVAECEAIVNEFNDNNCSFATVYFIENRENKEELLLDKNIFDAYLKALKCNNNYAKALHYVKASESISVSQKTTEIIRILYMNFKAFGISPKAYEIFDGDFTIDVAETLALDNFKSSNGTPVILMGIYNKQNDLIKILYLYSIYYNITKTGNGLFYDQLHKIDDRISTMKSRYKAIRMAFTWYDYDSLVAFLDWTSKIIIDCRYDGEFELYKTQIDLLLKEPKKKKSWENLIEKSTQNFTKQINSPFEYAVQCVYLLQFYKLLGEKDNQTEEFYKEWNSAEPYFDQLSKFAFFSKVSETTNFISLNIKLMDILPETYILKFADFFERNNVFLSRNAEINDNDIEMLYVLLLNKYNNSFEEDYINLAIKFYDSFSSRLNFYPELYENFCYSSNDKSVLFKTLFKLYSSDTTSDFHNFIYNNDWNCTREESKVFDILRIVYSLENDEIPMELSKLTYHSLQNFKNDVAMILQDYPKLTAYKTIIDKDESVAYKHLVMKYVMQIAFDQDAYWYISNKYWDTYDEKGIWDTLKFDSDGGISVVLGYYKVVYEKQAEFAQKLGIEYVSRRYNNLFLIDLYTALTNGQSVSDLNDEYIKELMRENDHFSLIYDKTYRVFKELVIELCESNLSNSAKKTLIFSVIRGSLGPLVSEEEVFNELLDGKGMHDKIKLLFKMTNYPSLAQNSLYMYINNKTELDIPAFCKATLPTTFDAIVSYNNLSNEDDKNKMREFIKYACVEMNRKQFMLSVIDTNTGYYNESKYAIYKPILTNVIIATIFNYNIIRDLGNIVRKGKIVFLREFFKDLLTQMDKESVYWYLCAIQQALSNNKKEARALFYHLAKKSEIPEIWGFEFDDLEKYIKGELPKFVTFGINNDFSSQKETAIEKTILIEIATNSVAEKIDRSSAKNAMRVFTNPNSNSQERLNAGAIILSFVKDDSLEIFEEISKSSDIGSAEHLTYNEFVFEYGLLVIKSRNTSSDKKFDVIFELFKFFDLLKDKNKRKFHEKLNNAFLNFFTTIKTQDNLISYKKWIEKSSAIIQIVEKNKIQFEGYDFFLSNLEKCVGFKESIHTKMDKIEFLEKMPNDISVAPITRNLLNSAKKELEKLKNGVIANISIGNKEIEDNSVFILVENPKESKTAINLNPDMGDAKFFVSVYNKRISENPIKLEMTCSGNIKKICPGQISAERIFLPEDYVTSTWEDGDAVEIVIVLDVNGEKVCDNKNEGIAFTYRKAIDIEEIKPARNEYKIASEAFTPGNKGFGRTSDKEWLNARIPVQNLSVIYGPSRVGKSSLLRYVENYLAVDYKHKTGPFKESEEDKEPAKVIDTLYVISHKQEYNNLPEQDEEKIAFLFLDPIIATLKEIIKSEMNYSDEDKDGDIIPREAMEQIIKTLEKPEKDVSLGKKLKLVSKELSKNNAEIWVLIDEFQQVLEKWPITQSDLFRNFCKRLGESGDSIRFIICGADELVKLMINKDSVFIYGDNTRVIGQFDNDDKKEYFKMLRDPAVWGNVKQPFTDEALEYIFTYTGGNALYGKMIGQQINESIKKGVFKKRRKIYPFDISSIVAQMLTEQKRDIRASFKVNEFVGNVTKNLETEEKYLLYIASLMLNDTYRTNVSISEIYNYFGADVSEGVKSEIDTALYLCSVRGILKWEMENNESVYSFSTPFYFTQYDELLKAKKVPERVEIANNTEDSNSSKYDSFGASNDVWNLYKTLNPEHRYEILSKVYLDDKLPKESMDTFKERIATNYYRDVITTQNNNILFNAPIQLINTAFTSLLSSNSADERLKAFKTLPRLEAFYTDSERDRMKELKAARHVTFDYSKGDVYELSASDVVVMNEIEEINTRAQNRYYGEMVSTMVKNSEEMPNSSVFSDPTDEELEAILGAKKPSQITLLKGLPKKYYRQLCFAVALHKLILPEVGVEIDYTDVDFSPISIMYCKLVEIMLKENHLELYGKALANETISSGESFSNLNEPAVLKNKWKDITIGTFVWHLIIQNVIISEQKVQNNSFFPNKKISNLKELSKFTGMNINDWKKHAKSLAEVVEIRNASAHGGTVVSKAVFDRLLKVLFTDEEGEIIRILELYQKKTNNR